MSVRKIIRVFAATGMLFLSTFPTISAFAAGTPIHVAICAECKSKAEGADKTKAATAAQWSGLIIGINDGARMFVITEAPQLNHIKNYAQRSVHVSDATIIRNNGDEIEFSSLPIGQKASVRGTYDSKKRTIYATEIDLGKIIATVPTISVPTASLPDATVPVAVAPRVITPAPTFPRNLKIGSRGDDVVALQKILTVQGYLKFPHGTALGYFGSTTSQALKLYQKKLRLPPSGIFGPMTRAKLQQ